MGTGNSKDPRRISFDNNFAIVPVIAIQKSIEDDNINGIANLTQEPVEDTFFQENNCFYESNDCDSTESSYWVRRIEHLKKEHQSITKIIESEYENTVKNTDRARDSFQLTHEKIHKLKPCYNWRAKIIQCYENNPGQPLMCSSVVQAFNQCVDSCRIME